MSFHAAVQWLTDTQLSTALREDPYPYPVLGTIHILSIALFGGMVAMGNLRVLGYAMREVPVSQVIDQFRAWKWTGFAILTVTGLLLTLSEPLDLYDNVYFWISLVLLALVGLNAWIFRNGIYRRVAEWDTSTIAPQPARRWAWISLVLWIALVFAGRLIAFG
jgi:SNF family Na+-dependent transporter